MIDRPKRNRLAEALRRLLSGRIDNLTFDDLDCPGGVIESDDRALCEVFYAAWLYYDDFRSHPLELTEVQKVGFKRCILFLHSDDEFEWPRMSLGIVDYIRRVAYELTGRRFESWSPPVGDRTVWPFFRRQDYERALRSPRLFRGKVEPGAPPNGGPATLFGNSSVTEGPPSVS